MYTDAGKGHNPCCAKFQTKQELSEQKRKKQIREGIGSLSTCRKHSALAFTFFEFYTRTVRVWRLMPTLERAMSCVEVGPSLINRIWFLWTLSPIQTDIRDDSFFFLLFLSFCCSCFAQNFTQRRAAFLSCAWRQRELSLLHQGQTVTKAIHIKYWNFQLDCTMKVTFELVYLSILTVQDFSAETVV